MLRRELDDFASHLEVFERRWNSRLMEMLAHQEPPFPVLQPDRTINPRNIDDLRRILAFDQGPRHQDNVARLGAYRKRASLPSHDAPDLLKGVAEKLCETLY